MKDMRKVFTISGGSGQMVPIWFPNTIGTSHSFKKKKLGLTSQTGSITIGGVNTTGFVVAGSLSYNPNNG